MELNKNQKAFCREYIKNGLNGLQAYKKVYKCSEDTAKVNASKLLTDTNIQKYVKELQKELEKKAIVTAEEIIKELKAIAFVDRTEISKMITEQKELDNTTLTYKKVDFADTNKLSSETKKVISGYKQTQSGYAVETYDKIKALELLGKYIGLFNDKQDITINNNIDNPYKELSTEELKKLAGE